MAIEEEFYIEIPDAEADEIKTVQQGQFIACFNTPSIVCGRGQSPLGRRSRQR